MGWWDSQDMESHKIHVPNYHQSIYVCVCIYIYKPPNFRIDSKSSMWYGPFSTAMLNKQRVYLNIFLAESHQSPPFLDGQPSPAATARAAWQRSLSAMRLACFGASKLVVSLQPFRNIPNTVWYTPNRWKSFVNLRNMGETSSNHPCFTLQSRSFYSQKGLRNWSHRSDHPILPMRGKSPQPPEFACHKIFEKEGDGVKIWGHLRKFARLGNSWFTFW